MINNYMILERGFACPNYDGPIDALISADIIVPFKIIMQLNLFVVVDSESGECRIMKDRLTGEDRTISLDLLPGFVNNFILEANK